MFVSLLMACALVAGQTCNDPSPGDRRADKTLLRIGTFNAAWLFDGISDPSGSPWNNETALLHIAKVAEQITRTGVDVMVLQETESCAVLDMLVEALGPEFKRYLIPGRDFVTRQQVALITRIDPSGPLARTEERAAFPVNGSSCGSTATGDSGVTKHAMMHIEATHFAFDLVTAHFRSGGNPSDCLQREAQATVIARHAVRHNVSAVIAGDFNDWDEQFDDAANRIGISQTLRIMMGTRFTNPAQWLARENRTSSGVGLIDHVLISAELLPRFLSITVDGSGYPTTSSARTAAFYSDHLPVVVELHDWFIPVVPPTTPTLTTPPGSAAAALGPALLLLAVGIALIGQ